MQSEHVFEITPKDWTHLIKHIVWFQFYKFSVQKFIFFIFTTTLRIYFDLLLQFRFRGGRRFCKIYSITTGVYRFISMGSNPYTTHAYTTFVLCVRLFPILFHEKKGNRIALNATKRDCNYVSILMDHIYYVVRVRQQWVLLYEFPVQRHILV